MNAGKKKSKKKIPKKIKELTWYKYIGKEIAVSLCMCCNETEICQMNFHCGHCVSEANGGSLEVDNMRPICSGCNGSMGSMNMNDFIKKFKLSGKIIEPVIVQKNFKKQINNPVEIRKFKDENGKVKYACNKCNREFIKKSYLRKHVDRKYSCDRNLPLDNTNQLACNNCGNIFKHKSSLSKHLNGRCKKLNNFEKSVDHSQLQSNHLESYNIYMANIRNNYVVICDGKKWNINKKEDAFEGAVYAKFTVNGNCDPLNYIAQYLSRPQ